ncbi:MAG: nitroreductase family protein [Firmicutes bacterium]|nr:nitroreductase family protein [Bacillota bacterium]
MGREFQYDIMEEIKKRWSPRAFSEEKVNKDDLYAIFEAARFAPSCFNEQPWKYIIAEDEKDLSVMRKFMFDGNRIWADKAQVLALVISNNTFWNGKKNRWNQFDAGTSWGYLSLEAQRRGLITHAMGGFDRKKVRKELNISDKYDIIAMIAIGKMGNKENLPKDIKEREKPGLRAPLNKSLINLNYFKDK